MINNKNKRLMLKMTVFLAIFFLLKGAPNYWFVKPLLIIDMIVIAAICVKMYRNNKTIQHSKKMNKNKEAWTKNSSQK